ncbi:PBS lyase HEAT-like repeat protein [Treponema vincentii ATCC 35580]|uniref:PBS lyase HEAT-like repeat protein n=1 Tax=Treponema vincentii ATCC 35580 TaxID=596324 RepID=C8PSS0_9SPIR|nr:HEAT repeat domain-containing protein [Treponema vincentii]EEV19531.1 PBS lyase HEAT-like repeat protein [Treponema vincentii ATCC 35580]
MKKLVFMMLTAVLLAVAPVYIAADTADTAASKTDNDTTLPQGTPQQEKPLQGQEAQKSGTEKTEGEKQELDEIEKARQALQYGLESEILEVVNKVDKQDFETLQGDFNRLFTETKSPAVREGLFGLYQKYEDAQLTESAVTILEDYEAQQRTLVKAALSYLTAVKPELTPALNEALQNMLTQDTAEYGAETVSVLGEIGGGEEAAFLASYFDSLTIDDAKQELILKQTIMAALEKLHSENTRDFLLERAEDENENIYVRSSAIAGLAQMGNPDVIPLLVKFFEQPEPLLREAAIRGAAAFDTAETRNLTLQGFKDSYYKVRLEALKTAQKTKMQEAAPYILYRAKYDPTDAVRFAAVEALAVLNTDEGNAWLSETFRDSKKSEKLRVTILSTALKHNPAALAADLDTVVLATVTDSKQKKLRYEFGKEIAKVENTVTGEICKAFLQSDDVLTKSIGLDMFKTNAPADARALVETIAQDDKQGALQRRAQRLLE